MSHIIETEGIVFRSIKYSETSIILDAFTKDHGLKSFIISGVRSAKSKGHSAVFQVMNIINLSYYRKDNDQLHRIKEYSYAHIYNHLQVDVIRSAVGIFMIECCRNTIKEKEENLALYSFIRQHFISLDGLPTEALSLFYIQFLIDLTVYLGFYPMDNFNENNTYFDLLNGCFTTHSLDSRHTMDAHSSVLLSSLLKNENLPSMTKQEKEKIVDYLITYYALHIESFKSLKSLEVLREVMR
jgi:DNA repair protein RecO (recombination protein O)